MRIAYGLAGEGRGHSTRAVTLVPHLLAQGHTVEFFTCCQAVEPLVSEGYIVYELPTPRIQYRNDQPSSLKTALQYPFWFFQHRSKIIDLAQYLCQEEYDVVISDYEPLLSRSAKLAHIPLVIYNNQSFATHCSLPDGFTNGDKLGKAKLAKINQIICPDADVVIIAKALPDKSLVNKNRTHLVGPPIKKEIQNKSWQGQNSDFIMMYVRPSIKPYLPVIKEFANSQGCRLRLYVASESFDLDDPDIEIVPAGPQFSQDMMTCRYLITNAGASTIGEACHIGCPIILIAEPRQIEGELNAKLTDHYYPNAVCVKLNKVSKESLEEAVQGFSGLGECHIDDGSAEVAQIINQFLEEYYSDRTT